MTSRNPKSVWKDKEKKSFMHNVWMYESGFFTIYELSHWWTCKILGYIVQWNDEIKEHEFWDLYYKMY